MEYLRKTVSSSELSGIFDLPQSLRNIKVEVIILPAEDSANAPETPKAKRRIGFAKDKIPPLPDSFFEPLPEEELQLWGL